MTKCPAFGCKNYDRITKNIKYFRLPKEKDLEMKWTIACQINDKIMSKSAIHMGVNCKEYQERIKCESALDEDAKQTREMLEEMVEKGEAIACPTCKVILMKKWGCDWLRCSMCKTEICWVTRGPRWGPAGKGDTSGGCKCGEKGVKCHPQCNYCH